LTDIDRRILGLRYGEEMSHREIGKIIGMEPDAVRKRISRALIRLREIAGGDEES
jgi:RNA polymerase sigma factor (sigma-70 family)